MKSAPPYIGLALPTSLTLNVDGSFSASNFPALKDYDLAKEFVLFDGSGTYRLAQYQDYWILKLHWQVMNGKRVNIGDMMHVMSNRPPHALHRIIGDPDSGDVLAFEKQP
jgi:hypothetical protein